MNPTLERYLRKYPITIYYLAYDNVCRGDIPTLRLKVFHNLTDALKFFPDLGNPLRWYWKVKMGWIVEWEAIDYLQLYAD